MTLDTLQELFFKIQEEKQLPNLMEHKFNLSVEIGKLHITLHDGNSTSERSHVLAVINAASTLESVLSDKIKDIKQQNNLNVKKDIREDKKALRRYNIEESNLAMACKRVLNRSTYKAIIKIAQEMPHNKINKLKERDLPMLILSVEDQKEE